VGAKGADNAEEHFGMSGMADCFQRVINQFLGRLLASSVGNDHARQCADLHGFAQEPRCFGPGIFFVRIVFRVFRIGHANGRIERLRTFIPAVAGMLHDIFRFGIVDLGEI
jgi:hypothetical protein